MMDSRVANLKSPEACEKFIKNAIKKGENSLANEARQRAVELRAQSHAAETVAERECLQAIYAYEAVLSAKNGKRTSASRTWQMVKRHGILKAAERAVDRNSETVGYKALVDMGLNQFAFEAVILRYPELFLESAVERSRERVTAWSDNS